MNTEQHSKVPERIRYISLEETRRHDTPEDLWMIIFNKVYNITNFASEHPGGASVLYDCGGSDGTEAFVDVGHSFDAFEMLKPYYMGDVEIRQQKRHDTNIYDMQQEELNCVKEYKFSGLKLMKLFGLSRVKGFLEEIWIFILVGMAFTTVIVYIMLQKLKWEHQAHDY